MIKMVSIESYTLGVILIVSFIVFSLLLGMLTGGRKKNILKTEFWVIFGFSITFTILLFILITANIIDINLISQNEIFKSIFNLK